MDWISRYCLKYYGKFVLICEPHYLFLEGTEDIDVFSGILSLTGPQSTPHQKDVLAEKICARDSFHMLLAHPVPVPSGMM